MTDTTDAPVAVVLTTAPDVSVAEALVTQLVEERLIACANIIPGVRSIYRWEGEVRTEDEVMVVLKTTMAVVDALRDRIISLHPYDLPEVLAITDVSGSDAYTDWIRGEVRGPS